MTSDPSDPFAGEIVDERWKIGDKLGSGGMGVVYRAERVKLGRAVAIKFLEERAVHSKDAVARFEREARATSRLTHRHCVSILDFGVWRHRPYIVMEFVDGRPLNQEMGRPSMTPSRAIGIMRQILEALRHAHASGVVHRDLKPENVMLTEATGNEDFVKLLDFGLAKIIAVDEPTISHPRMIAGTPSYMSPEQARGEKADHRTDIYSAGVILYGMCTGQKPFRAEDQVALLRMHMSVPPPSPRKVAPDKHISPELERVILKSLEKDRNARYYHAGEFLTALEATPEARGLVVRGRRRRRALVAAVALTVAGVGAAGAWRWQTRLHERLEATRRLWQPTPAPPTTTPPIASTPTITATAPAATATPTATAPSEAVDAAIAAVTATAPSGATAAPASGATAAPASGATAAPSGATIAATTTPTVTPAPAAAIVDASAPPSHAVAVAPVAAASTPHVDAPIAPLPPTPQAPLVSPEATQSARSQVAALLDAERLADAERLLRAQAILEPHAGWVHLQLGEVYARRIWRKDAEHEWDTALTLDPSLRHDPQLGARLCQALGPAWGGTAQRIVLRHLGAAAVAPLTTCIREATDLAHLQAAVHLMERLPHASIDRALVAARTAELTPKKR